MPKKMHFFDTVSSSVVLGKTQESTKRNVRDVPADWVRLCTSNAFLNGVPLSTYREQYNKFSSEADLQEFFSKEIFPKLGLPDSQRESVIKYLQTYFHQQGFLSPVTNPVQHELNLIGLQHEHKGVLTIPSERLDRNMNITVNAEGLLLQEMIEVPELKFAVGKQIIDLKPDDPKTRNYIIKAEGTLHFDFSKNASEPNITIKSNKISVGRADLKEKFLPNDFLSKIWDFIANLCGFNKVELLEIEESAKIRPKSGNFDN